MYMISPSVHFKTVCVCDGTLNWAFPDFWCCCFFVPCAGGSHMKETTVRHYAQNVAQFFDYIAETPPTSCRLSRTVLIGLRREMRWVLKTMDRAWQSIRWRWRDGRRTAFCQRWPSWSARRLHQKPSMNFWVSFFIQTFQLVLSRS